MNAQATTTSPRHELTIVERGPQANGAPAAVIASCPCGWEAATSLLTIGRYELTRDFNSHVEYMRKIGR